MQPLSEILFLQSILEINEDVNRGLEACITDTERLYLQGKKNTLKEIINKIYGTRYRC